MKSAFFAGTAAVMFGLVIAGGLAPRGTAGEPETAIVVPRQYIALARMLADSRGDLEKAREIAAKAVASVVEKGEDYDEKIRLLAEISTALMAAVADWDEPARAAIAVTLVEAALKLAPEGDEGALQRIGYVRQVFAAMAYGSSDSVPLVAALDVVPDALRQTATDAISTAVNVLGGRQAWACKDLYDAVRKALGEETPERMLRDQVIVTVTTTTTTTTSTTTTTTTIPGSAGISIRDRPTPTPVPTTRPSPTPVGLR